jgi:4-cresol dehydrogenase (hydroxylating)
VHTGFGSFANAIAARVYKPGVGPTLDGLFTQSNLGIVTELTMWLRPKPKCFQTITALVDDDRLEPLIDVLRGLALEGALEPTFGIWNDAKFLAAMRQYPFDEAKSVTPLPDALRMKLGLRGRWLLSAALFSKSDEHGLLDRRYIKRALAPITRRILFLDEKRARVASLVAGPIRKLSGFDPAKWVAGAYSNSAFLGVPSTLPIRQAYWRKRMKMPAVPDPDRDRCGVVCLAPVSPFDGRHSRKVVSVLERHSKAFGFEPNLTLLCVTPRHIDLAALLVYDRDVAKDEARALACHDAAAAELNELGYLPYRLGVHAMDSLPRPQDDSLALRRALKHTLDPNDVLAPGRYDLRSHWHPA